MDVKQEAETYVEWVSKFKDNKKFIFNAPQHQKAIKHIKNLLKELEAKNNIINDLRKQNSKGEINEAYAEKIEADKELISLLKQKINKLEQKAGKIEATKRKLAEAEKVKVAAIKVHDAFYTVSLDTDETSPANARSMQDKIYKLKDTISDYEASKGE